MDHLLILVRFRKMVRSGRVSLSVSLSQSIEHGSHWTVGSLLERGSIPYRGSLRSIASLPKPGVVMTFDSLVANGSPFHPGSIWPVGSRLGDVSLTVDGSLALHGSISVCGTLPPTCFAPRSRCAGFH